jgi:hypothetical protein
VESEILDRFTDVQRAVDELSDRHADHTRQYHAPGSVASFDVPVNGEDHRILVVDFEFVVPFGSQVYCRPNSNAVAVLNHYVLNDSTHTPDVASAEANGMNSLNGILLALNTGATGQSVSAGRLTIGSRLNGTRRVFRVDSVTTNDVGSSNTWTRLLTVGGIWEHAAGAIGSLWFGPSAGLFASGTVRVQDRGR